MSRNKKAPNMSEQATQATETVTRKRKTGPRGPQKVFAVLSIKDSDGNEVDVRKGKGYEVNLTLSKDQAGIIEMLTDGKLAFVTQLEVPKANAADEGEEEDTSEAE